MSNRDTLPTISIIVPNYQGGATIERTLQSLIDQNYPHLEIIVVDGGSTDNSLEIIRRYEKHLAWWVSEKDRGQSDAINKGYTHTTGQLINWLCSDDYLLPGALHRIGQYFADHPETDILSARLYVEYLPAEGSNQPPVREASTDMQAWHLDLLPVCNIIPQQSTFWRKHLVKRETLIRQDLHSVMDFELWNYLKINRPNWQLIPDILAVFVMGQNNKTASLALRDQLLREQESVYRQYCHERISLAWWYRHLMLPVQLWRGRTPKGMKKIIGLGYKLAFIALLGPFYGFRRVRWMNLGALG